MPATPAASADLLEAEAALVAEQVVGRAVVGDEEVDAVVVVEVGGDDAQARGRPVSAKPADVGDVDEPAAVVAEDVVGSRLDLAGIAVEVLAAARSGRGAGCRRVPEHVVADVEVEVAVVVEVGEGRRGRPVARARQARARGDVLEGPVAAVAVERSRTCNRVTNRSGWPSLS